MIWRVMMLAALGLALAATAQAGDVAAGKAKAQLCAVCHGAAGISAMPNVPSLAAEPDPFLEWQLVYFRTGARQNPLMNPIAATLSDDDVQNLGAYFASLPAPKPAAATLDPALMSAAVAAIKKYRCASCHGANFAGLDQAARLAGQREDYLLKALHDFKTGARRGGGGAAAMPSVAFSMSDAEMKAVAYYLSHHP